jgi:hypothetical protein
MLFYTLQQSGIILKKSKLFSVSFKSSLQWDACMDAGSRAPTVGALGDAGAVAERVG